MVALPDVETLLTEDEARPFNNFRENALWSALLTGKLGATELQRFAALWWTVVGGRARHADSAIVSHLPQEDGKIIFRDMLEMLEDPARDPERLWRNFAAAVSCSNVELECAAANPPLAAIEYLTTMRRFGHASPHEGAAVLHLLAGALPDLHEQAATALQASVPADALAYFRVEGDLWSRRREYAAHLVAAYCDTPYKGYEGRRAVREVAFAWQCLGDDVGKAVIGNAS